jgi:hypothetical protein
MSAPTAKFLMELLEAEVFTIKAIELQLAHDGELTSQQRETLRMLQGGYVLRREQLRQAIIEHESP